MASFQTGESGRLAEDHSAAEIRTWLISRISAEAGIAAERVRPDDPILSFGIDSMQVVTLIAGLEDWLGFRFAESPLDEHPTIQALSEFAASQRTSP